MISQALVLAGGLGTRLGELTRDIPKPMVDVSGRPFLEHLLRHLAAQGIRDFVLCTGYKHEVIERHFGDGEAFGIKVHHVIEKELLGTGGAIRNAFPLLQERFLVISGDNHLQVPLAALEKISLEKNAGGVLSCWTNDPPLFRRNVRLDEKTGRILDYHFSQAEGKNFVDVGVKLFHRRVEKFFPAQAKFSLETEVLPKLAAAGELYGMVVPHPPLDVGTLEGLAEARRLFNEGKVTA